MSGIINILFITLLFIGSYIDANYSGRIEILGFYTGGLAFLIVGVYYGYSFAKFETTSDKEKR